MCWSRRQASNKKLQYLEENKQRGRIVLPKMVVGRRLREQVTFELESPGMRGAFLGVKDVLLGAASQGRQEGRPKCARPHCPE